MADTTNLSADDIPYDYQPFEEVDLCGNILRDVRFLIRLKDQHPLLIGKGTVPYVWLYAPTSADLNRWSLVVERNTALSPPFRVTVDRMPTTSVRVFGFGKQMLLVVNESPEKIVIPQIDLTPIGINVVGHQGELRVGGKNLVGNTMAGVETFIGLR
jgi:hypothetical protein